jgi:hypothetical protein
MKPIARLMPVLCLIAGSAFGCPDFSGKYQVAGDQSGQFTIVQTGCESWQRLSEGANPWVEKLDGKTYVLVDDGNDVMTDRAYWDGAKLVSVGELLMKDIQPPNNVVMSFTDEYTREANGDLTLIETQVDHLFGDGSPKTTTTTYKRVQ